MTRRIKEIHNAGARPAPSLSDPKRQKGMSTLATTIFLLIGVTLITLNANRMGALELNLSNIHESRKSAFNRSDAGADALFVNANNIIDYNDPPGQVYCTAETDKLPDPGACDELKIVSPTLWPDRYVYGKNQGELQLERFGCPPRAFSTSCSATTFAHFQARSIYDDTANKGGKSESVIGAMTLLPAYQ